MINPLDLQGKTIIVTGASAGIGRDCSILLSELGARIILMARSIEKLEETKSLLHGENHVMAPYDLQCLEGIPPLLKTLAGTVGPCSGLVHCAGIQSTRPLRALDAGDVEQHMRLNVSAGLILVQAFRQKGVRSDEAGVVFISSVLGLVGEAARSVYSATKSALFGLTRSLAIELSRERIRVNCVAPAVVDTAMANSLRATLSPEQFATIESAHPLGIGEPRDVAYAVSFLLARTARWITGSILVVDGGYTAR